MLYNAKESKLKADNKDIDYISFGKGKKYLIPNDADSYLRRIYGDYTQLPPMAQQKPHHNNDL